MTLQSQKLGNTPLTKVTFQQPILIMPTTKNYTLPQSYELVSRRAQANLRLMDKIGFPPHQMEN